MLKNVIKKIINRIILKFGWKLIKLRRFYLKGKNDFSYQISDSSFTT